MIKALLSIAILAIGTGATAHAAEAAAIDSPLCNSRDSNVSAAVWKTIAQREINKSNLITQAQYAAVAVDGVMPNFAKQLLLAEIESELIKKKLTKNPDYKESTLQVKVDVYCIKEIAANKVYNGYGIGFDTYEIDARGPNRVSFGPATVVEVLVTTTISFNATPQSKTSSIYQTKSNL